MPLGKEIGKGIKKLVMRIPYARAVIEADIEKAKREGEQNPLRRFHAYSLYKHTGAITKTPCPSDVNLAQRISDFYRSIFSRQGERIYGSDQWESLNKSQRQDIHNILINGDCGLIANALADPRKTNLLYGMDNLCRDLHNPKNMDEWSGTHAFSTLLRLAEAWGVKRLVNPELLPSEPDTTVNNCIERLERQFNIHIDFPNPYPGEHGLPICRDGNNQEVASYRAIQALHQVLAILDRHGNKDVRVLEIGAGVGRTAYYAKKFGFRDYTLVDLPLTCVAQAHYLGTVLGGDKIQLPGEEEKPSAIKILLPESFLAGDMEKVDVILNADSLTEMGLDTMQRYWNQIKKSCNMFISINHEANAHTVREIILGDPQVKSYTRDPYWLRNGYVQEIVTF